MAKDYLEKFLHQHLMFHSVVVHAVVFNERPVDSAQFQICANEAF